MNFVKSVINDWDPSELLFHAPDDEYHSEIDEIQHLLRVTDDSAELAEGIFKVFLCVCVCVCMKTLFFFFPSNVFLLHLVYCSGFLGIEPPLIVFLFIFIIFISIFRAEAS